MPMTDDRSPRAPAASEVLALAADAADAEFELDLRGLGIHAALHALEHMIAKPYDRERTVAILVGVPGSTGGVPLFQPVGRRLKELLADRRLASVRPVAPDRKGPGFLVRLPPRR